MRGLTARRALERSLRRLTPPLRQRSCVRVDLKRSERVVDPSFAEPSLIRSFVYNAAPSLIRSFV